MVLFLVVHKVVEAVQHLQHQLPDYLLLLASCVLARTTVLAHQDSHLEALLHLQEYALERWQLVLPEAVLQCQLQHKHHSFDN